MAPEYEDALRDIAEHLRVGATKDISHPRDFAYIVERLGRALGLASVVPPHHNAVEDFMVANGFKGTVPRDMMLVYRALQQKMRPRR